MSDFNQLVTHAVRLAILQVLEQDPDYSHNEHVLQTVLASLGHNLSGDRVRTEMRWLEEQQLVSVHEIGSLLIARITGRGVDVALGRSRVDGIARPRP